MNLIFYDVDTQNDFMEKKGTLYVPGAETIIPNLKRIKKLSSNIARIVTGISNDPEFSSSSNYGMLVVQHGGLLRVKEFVSEDYHSMKDPEISMNPDYKKTFPPHCMEGTYGQKKTPATAALRPLYLNEDGAVLDGKKIKDDSLEWNIRDSWHNYEIVFRKQKNEIQGHRYVDHVFDIIEPDTAIVYGVATEFCVNDAVNYLLNRHIQTFVVEDAIKAINSDSEKNTLEYWKANRVKFIKTSELTRNNRTSTLAEFLRDAEASK